MESPLRQSERFIPHAMLVLAALIWGFSFPMTRSGLAYADALTYLLLRFGLAAVLLIVVFGRKFLRDLKTMDSKLALGLVGVGFFNFLGFTAQTLGLETASSARAAFLTGLYAVFVPFLLPVFRMGLRFQWADLLALSLCLMGTAVMSGVGASDFSWNAGDFWLLACAFFYALAILSLHRLTLNLSQEASRLNADSLTLIQIVSTFFFILLYWLVRGDFRLAWSQELGGSLLYNATLSTCVAIWLQTRFQSNVAPQMVTFIFNLEPFFASIVATTFFGEAIGSKDWIGGTLIVCAIIATEWFKQKMAIRRGITTETREVL